MYICTCVCACMYVHVYTCIHECGGQKTTLCRFSGDNNLVAFVTGFRFGLFLQCWELNLGPHACQQEVYYWATALASLWILKQGLSLPWRLINRLDWLAHEPQGSTCLPAWSWSCQYHHLQFYGFILVCILRIELKFLCLWCRDVMGRVISAAPQDSELLIKVIHCYILCRGYSRYHSQHTTYPPPAWKDRDSNNGLFEDSFTAGILLRNSSAMPCNFPRRKQKWEREAMLLPILWWLFFSCSNVPKFVWSFLNVEGN